MRLLLKKFAVKRNIKNYFGAFNKISHSIGAQFLNGASLET